MGSFHLLEYRVSDGDDEKVLQADSGCGCTALYSVLLNCILPSDSDGKPCYAYLPQKKENLVLSLDAIVISLLFLFLPRSHG
jgi:hypothetical protein